MQTSRRQLLVAGAALTASAALTLAGCGQQAPATTTDADQGPGTQQFTDKTGVTVRVPTRPQRIVSLQEWSSGVPLLSIGAPVVGVSQREGKFDEQLQTYDLSNVQSVGNDGTINMEALVALEPDLIIGNASDGKGYLGETGLTRDTLQAIAPVVFLDDTVSVDDSMTAIATLTGMTAEVAQQKAAYDQQMTEFTTKFASLRGKLSVALIGMYGGNLYATTPDNPGAAVKLVQALGLPLPPVEAGGTGGNVEISAEKLSDLSADLIIYSTRYGVPTLQPLWKTLPAVKAGQTRSVYQFLAGNAYATYADTIAELSTFLNGVDPTVVDESTW